MMIFDDLAIENGDVRDIPSPLTVEHADFPYVHPPSRHLNLSKTVMVQLRQKNQRFFSVESFRSP